MNRLVQQPGAVDQLHLADARNVIDREQTFDLDPRPCLLPGFALSAGTGRLVELEKARRQGPIAVLRFDRTANKQNALFPSGDRAHDDLGIVVKDITAFDADHAFAIVAFWDASNRWAAALPVVRHAGLIPGSSSD